MGSPNETVSLEQTAAMRAARWQLGDVDLAPRQARHALEAADERRVAVDLEEAEAAGEAVHVVDVLRDDGLHDAELFERHERQMSRVRLRGGERRPQLGHRPLRLQP